MGKLSRGFLGGFQGQLGTAYGCFWRLMDLIKAMPRKSGRPPTELQMFVQLRFALITAFLKPIKILIKQGYQSAKNGMSPMNAAVSYHLKNAVTGVAPDYSIDYPKVVFSVGELEAPNSPKVVAAPDGMIDYTWGALLDPELGDPTDQAIFLVYNLTRKAFSTLRNAAARSELTYSLQLPLDWMGEEVECYMSFTSTNGKVVSNSAYAGHLQML